MCFPLFSFLVIVISMFTRRRRSQKEIEKKNTKSYAATSTFELYWDEGKCHRLYKKMNAHISLLLLSFDVHALCVRIQFHFSFRFIGCYRWFCTYTKKKRMRAIEKEQLNCSNGWKGNTSGQSREIWQKSETKTKTKAELIYCARGTMITTWMCSPECNLTRLWNCLEN